jgi:hypothetical protein
MKEDSLKKGERMKEETFSEEKDGQGSRQITSSSDGISNDDAKVMA